MLFRSLREQGIKLMKERYRLAECSVESGYHQAKDLLDKEPDIDILSCATDTIAAGVMQALKERKPDKLKSVATDAATALASGVSSLFGSGKMKSLERKNEDLRDEIAIRDETIEQLQSNIKQMEVEHQKQIQEVKQSYEAENRKLSEYIDKILRYFPYVEKLMPMIKYLSEKMGFNDNLIKAL